MCDGVRSMDFDDDGLKCQGRFEVHTCNDHHARSARAGKDLAAPGMAGSTAFSTFWAITLRLFELQTSRSEHPSRNAEIHQMAGSRACSTFWAITLLLFELQTSRSEHPNRNAEIYQIAGSGACSYMCLYFSYVCLYSSRVCLYLSCVHLCFSCVRLMRCDVVSGDGAAKDMRCQQTNA